MFVYFIQCGKNGPIKIGKSNNVEKRIIELQVANPEKLKIIGKISCESDENAKRVEKNIQGLFRSHRIRGEWFRSSINLNNVKNFESASNYKNNDNDINFIIKFFNEDSRGIDINEILIKTGLSRKKIKNALKSLLHRGKISIDEHGKYFFVRGKCI